MWIVYHACIFASGQHWQRWAVSWHLTLHSVRGPAQLWAASPITTYKFLLGFWARGLTSLNFLNLETNYFSYIFKKNVWLTYFAFINKTQNNNKNKGGWFGEQLIKWNVSHAFSYPFEKLISGRSKMEGKVAMFLQPKLAFAFQSVIKDRNSSISSFLVPWFPCFM